MSGATSIWQREQVSFAVNGPCRIFYEVYGAPDDPLLVLVNGMGSQCINYPVAWCEMFAARGFRVVRLDNRDVGLTTKFDDAPTDESGAAYTLSDMAADVIAVLDDLGTARAHVLGLSLGGMIVQTLAIEHPDRLLSMTSVMSRTNEAGYGDSTPEALALLMAPPATDRDSYVQGWVDGLREWGSPAFADESRWRADANAAFDRCFHPSGPTRQFLAARASGARSDALRGVTTPTLVIHGSADTLITPSGGRRTAELIPGARYVEIEGMGHDYPPQLWSRWVDEFCALADTVGK